MLNICRWDGPARMCGPAPSWCHVVTAHQVRVQPLCQRALEPGGQEARQHSVALCRAQPLRRNRHLSSLLCKWNKLLVEYRGYNVQDSSPYRKPWIPWKPGKCPWIHFIIENLGNVHEFKRKPLKKSMKNEYGDLVHLNNAVRSTIKFSSAIVTSSPAIKFAYRMR